VDCPAPVQETWIAREVKAVRDGADTVAENVVVVAEAYLEDKALSTSPFTMLTL
jgi:hypothetical protein